MTVYQEKNKNKLTKDGRSWYFRCYYTDGYGNRKQKESKKFFMKKDALDAEREFLNSLEISVPTKKMTIYDLKNEYLEYKKQTVKITTIGRIKVFSKYFEIIDNVIINDFDIKTFEKWKKSINEINVSATYKNKIYTHLKALLKYAIRFHDFYKLETVLNKMEGFSNPNELKKEMKYFTYEEFKKFIIQEKDIKYKTFFEILYYCGLRKNEANALTWNDIDFEKNIIRINKSVALKIKGIKYKILPPKTNSSNRILPITVTLKESLLQLKHYYEKHYNFSKDWFVFGGVYPIGETSLCNHKNKCCDAAHLDRIRIHDFRHSCASLLINNGASISLVSKYLGHSNISTTLNVYTHFFKNEFEDIICLINNLDK